MQPTPFERFGSPMEDQRANTMFSPQPLHASAAAGPGDSIGNLRILRIRHTVRPEFVCLFFGCGHIFVDELSLDRHQQIHHSPIVPGYGNHALHHRITSTSMDSEPDYLATDADSTVTSNANSSSYTTSHYQDSQVRHQNQSTSNIDDQSHHRHVTNNAQQHLSQTSPHPDARRGAPARRHHCPHHACSTSTTRRSDLSRHMLTHQIGPRAFDCRFPTCNRKGLYGFARSDKMEEHYRNMHQ